MKNVKLNIIIYIFNLIMVVIGKTKTIELRGDGSGNLIIETKKSGKFVEISCNEVKIIGQVTSNYLNNKFSVIENTISTISGGNAVLNLSILESSFNTLRSEFDSLNYDNTYANKSLFEDLSQNYYKLENSFNILNFDSSYISNTTFLELSQNFYSLENSFNNLNFDSSYTKNTIFVDLSQNFYNLENSFNTLNFDCSYTNKSLFEELSSNFYSLEESLTNYVLETSLNNYITRTQLDTSLANISISGDYITRSQLDASFANINTNISGNFVSESSFNELQNKSDNFFFFFKLKPWSLIYTNGNYSYSVTGYGNEFKYNIGDFSLSHIDNLSTTSKNLQLFWKIPPRIFLDSNLSFNNINYVPLYNNLIIEYKEQNENNWSQIVNVNNFPDSSNNINYSNYNNKNDLSMNFVLNLTRNTGVPENSVNYNIVDNSFIINLTGGYNYFQNSKAYQFRCYLNNISDICNNFDFKQDAYNNISSNIYLYFPDISNLYFYTASRGLPKAPTSITFANVDFDSLLINGQLNSTTADINNIIVFPIPDDDNDNKIVFILDLIANKNTNYKKFIPFNLNNFIIDDISNINNPSTIAQFSLAQTNNIEPEFTYNLSNYGIYFLNDVSNISYSNISSIFITPPPLRTEVDTNLDFNYYLNNYPLFNSNLINYNSNLNYNSVRWRETNQTISFYFFDDSNSIFNINSNNLNHKLFNSLKTLNFNNKNTINEPKGIDLNNNNLCSFVMYSQKIKDSIESNIYNPLTLDTSFNNFLTTNINNNNINYTLNYTSQDILPNGANTINDYTNKNGYYVGLILKDISYNIDLNDFFNITTDLCFNNINLRTKISQIFDTQNYNKQQDYLIYKITNDLSQNIILDSSSSIFNLTYNESNQGTYFGLTSIKPHNSIINLQFNGTLNNLSKYIRSNSNNILSNINLKVSGTHNSNNNSNNSININWETNNNTTKNISHDYNFYPLNGLNSNHGTYEGVNSLNGFADVIIYNNLFSQNSTINYNNLNLGNVINITNKYYWNLGRLTTINTYFKETNIIVFNNNPLNNIDHNFMGGTLYDPNLSTSYIKYNQALYQKYAGSNFFYSGNNNNIYKNYTIYQNNNNPNLDYSLLDNSGDNINYTINIPFWFNSSSSNKVINNIYKWVCFDIDLTTLSLTSDNVTLNLQNININNIGTDYLFYIKLKYNGNLQISGQNILYSKWFDCLSVLNTGLSDSQRVTKNLSGIYNNNIAAGTYPLQLILPYLSSYASNLTLLIGLYNSDLNINDLFINFN